MILRHGCFPLCSCVMDVGRMASGRTMSPALSKSWRAFRPQASCRWNSYVCMTSRIAVRAHRMSQCDAYEKQQRFLDAFSAFWKASLLLMDNQRTDWQDAGLKLAARALHQAAGVEDLVGIISAELDYTGQDFVDKCKQNMSALVVDDLECVLCFNSLFRPVTTACGHVMCRACIARSLDHRYDYVPSRTSFFMSRGCSPQCAMCRQPLPFFLARHQLPVTRAIESIFEVRLISGAVSLSVEFRVLTPRHVISTCSRMHTCNARQRMLLTKQNARKMSQFLCVRQCSQACPSRSTCLSRATASCSGVLSTLSRRSAWLWC